MREISTKSLEVGEHVMIDGVEYVVDKADQDDVCKGCALFRATAFCSDFIGCDGIIFKKVEKEPEYSPAVNTKAKSLKIIYDELPKAEMPQTEDWGLRDWVALSCIDAAYHHCRKTGKVEAKRIARYAYDLADAMLEERAQG